MRLLHLLLIPATLAFLSPAIKGSEKAPNKPAATRTAGMVTRTWYVSISFFGQENTPLDVEAALKDKRVRFPEGSSARYDEATRILTVHNTPEQLMAVEAALFDYRKQIPFGQKEWKLSNACIQKLSKDKKSLKKNTLECVRSLGYPVISAELNKNELNVQAALQVLEKLSTILEADNLGAVPGKTKHLGYMKLRAYWHQTGMKNSIDESAPLPAPEPEDIILLDNEDSPHLYKQTWKVPKSFLAKLDEDDTGCLWKADAQICLTMMTSIRFLNVKGASASFRNGKLTVIHRQECLDELQAFLTDSCTQIGKATPVSVEDAEQLKPQKRKKKVKTSDGRVLDIEELYNEFESNKQNEE